MNKKQAEMKILPIIQKLEKSTKSTVDWVDVTHSNKIGGFHSKTQKDIQITIKWKN